MSVQELKRGYDELPKTDQILFASLIAAEQLTRDSEFIAEVSRRHREMDEGKKWSHADMLQLHEELKSRGL